MIYERKKPYKYWFATVFWFIFLIVGVGAVLAIPIILFIEQDLLAALGQGIGGFILACFGWIVLRRSVRKVELSSGNVILYYFFRKEVLSEIKSMKGYRQSFKGTVHRGLILETEKGKRTIMQIENFEPSFFKDIETVTGLQITNKESFE